MLADELQAAGDPRGRLIALQAAPRTPEIDAEVAALLAAHRELVPDLPVELDWHLGFLRGVVLGRWGYSGYQLPDDAIARVLACPSARYLRRLSLMGGCTIPSLAPVARTLEVLELSGREPDLNAIAPCRALRELRLRPCEHFADIDALTGLPLEALDLARCPWSDRHAGVLASLPLRDLSLATAQSLTPAGVAAIARAPLERLLLDTQTWTDDLVIALAGATRLRALAVGNAVISERGTSVLAALPIEQLSLFASAADDAAIRALSPLRLRGLQLWDSRNITDAVCEALPATLENLWLGTTRVTGAGLRALAGRPLRVLQLAVLPLTDADVRALLAFPDLAELDLSATRVTDACVETLVQLPLVKLDLASTAITPAAIDRLTATGIQVIGLADTSDAVLARARMHAWTVREDAAGLAEPVA